MGVGSPRFHELLDQAWELHSERAGDYGSDADALANLRAQTEAGYTQYDGCVIELGNIQRRINNLMRPFNLSNQGQGWGPARMKKFRKQLRNALMDKAAFSYLAIIMLEDEGVLNPALEAEEEQSA